MASGLVFILLLCLSCGLWVGADARCGVTTRGTTRGMTRGMTQGQPRRGCPSGWDQYGQRCFLFFNYERDWATAERTCISHGANLASFHSHHEYVYLKNLVNRKKGSYVRTWLGGTDAAKDGVWLWTNGSKFNYVSWGRGEPNNNGGREDCMEINLRGRVQHLNDEKCSRRNYFICAKKV
ncbi:hypothetical protein XENORESO_007427 [Xenotaenia resolanae]|uniref:C-type lectin domain-containing protein n=1 Tax=Xenotaenia resolanae TaxID=208358 RepID=A0ABV0WVN7_9TELE